MNILHPCTVNRRITQQFGRTAYSHNYSIGVHNGIDFSAKGVVWKENLQACFGGVVKVKYDKSGYGTHVRIRNLNGYEAVYGHLSKVLVKDGQTVLTGDIIGVSGNTGNSTADHLHFGVRELNISDKNIWFWTVKNYQTAKYCKLPYGYFDPILEDRDVFYKNYPFIIDKMENNDTKEALLYTNKAGWHLANTLEDKELKGKIQVKYSELNDLVRNNL